MINSDSAAGPARRRPAASRSLQAKLLYVSLGGLLLGFAVFFAARALCALYIDNVYMSSDAVSARRDGFYSSFRTYVTANSLSGTDYAKISTWTRDNPYAALLVYVKGGGGRRVHISGGSVRPPEGDEDTADTSTSLGSGTVLYPIRFSDGVYLVAISDTSQLHAEQLAAAASVALGVLCFAVLNLLYAHRLASRVTALSREAEIVSGRQLDHSIPVRGSDELAFLAQSMDDMRLAVIRHMDDESRAWEANSGLITAMSHDIRTPMTSLLGYLSLLNEGGLDAERSRQFISAAYGKAVELKGLTDELFSYFLVFGRAKPEVKLEPLDGELLFEQLISEAEFDLRDSGFNVHRIGSYPPCTVSADPLHLSRVMNNLVSNIKKYAEPTKQVTFVLEITDGLLCFCASNYIRTDSPRTESTRIGFRSCSKVMEYMGGSFGTTADDAHFSAELRLPAELK